MKWALECHVANLEKGTTRLAVRNVPKTVGILNNHTTVVSTDLKDTKGKKTESYTAKMAVGRTEILHWQRLGGLGSLNRYAETFPMNSIS